MAEARSQETNRFSLTEVATHNEKKSTWIVIHDNVYDVTKFLEEHPGGEEVLLEQGGKDATESFEDVGHSTDARDLMTQYHIGELVEEDKAKTKKIQERSWGSGGAADGDGTGGESNWKTWALPVGIALGATFLYRFYLNFSAAAN